MRRSAVGGKKRGGAILGAAARIARMAGVGTMRAAVVDLHGAGSVRAASVPFQGPAGGAAPAASFWIGKKSLNSGGSSSSEYKRSEK